MPHMRKSVLVYISGPLTPSTENPSLSINIYNAIGVYFALIKSGIPAFCPHLSGLVQESFEIDYQIWIDYDYAIIDRCTHMLMMPRWRESKGARLEKDYAEAKLIGQVKIYYNLYKMIGDING